MRSKAGTHSVLKLPGKKDYETECCNCGMPVHLHGVLACEGIYVPPHVWKQGEARHAKKAAKEAALDPDFAEFANKFTKG